MVDDVKIFQRPSSIGPNASQVYDLMDVQCQPPEVMTPGYVEACSRAAVLLRSPVLVTPTSLQIGSLLSLMARPPGVTNPYYSSLAPSLTGDFYSRLDVRNSVFSMKKNCSDVIAKVNALMLRARNADVQISSNPFLTISELIRQRERDQTGNAVINESDAGQLIMGVNSLLDFLDKTKNGQIDLNKDVFNVSQISSFDFSLEGFGTFGKVEDEILKFVPTTADFEAIRTREDREANIFRYKIPRVIFTADYAPEGKVRGTLLCFKALDASGYQIRKRNVFTGQVYIYTKSSDELKKTTDLYIDYAQAWCGNFYDQIKAEQLVIFLDEETQDDCLYSYSIMAYQNLSKGKSLFDVASKAVATPSLPPGNKDIVDSSVNQWEKISTSIHGSAYYDWAVCGVSYRAAELANVSLADRTKGYSYTSKASEIPANKLKAASQIQDVMKNYYDCVNRMGLDATVRELLVQTGIIAFFESSDALISFYSDRQRLSNSGPRSSKLLQAVQTAVDEKMATVDLSLLQTQVSKLFDDFKVKNQKSGQILAQLKNISSFDSDGKVDVLTPRGISSFFRMMRAFALAELGVFKAIEAQISADAVEVARRQRELDEAYARAVAERQRELAQYATADVLPRVGTVNLPPAQPRTTVNTVIPAKAPLTLPIPAKPTTPAPTPITPPKTTTPTKTTKPVTVPPAVTGKLGSIKILR